MPSWALLIQRLGLQVIIELQANVLSILQSSFMKYVKPLGSMLFKDRN